jgi:hypothetical protein
MMIARKKEGIEVQERVVRRRLSSGREAAVVLGICGEPD